jgi:hypothetical protein
MVVRHPSLPRDDHAVEKRTNGRAGRMEWARRQNNKRRRPQTSEPVEALTPRSKGAVRCGAGRMQQQQRWVMSSPSHTLVLDSGSQGLRLVAT